MASSAASGTLTSSLTTESSELFDRWGLRGNANGGSSATLLPPAFPAVAPIFPARAETLDRLEMGRVERGIERGGTGAAQSGQRTPSFAPASPAASTPNSTAPIPLSRFPKPPVLPSLAALALGALPAALALLLGRLLDLFARYARGRFPPLIFTQHTNNELIIIAALGGLAILLAGLSKGLFEKWATQKELELRKGAFERLLGAAMGIGGNGEVGEWKMELERTTPLFKQSLLQYSHLITLTGSLLSALIISLYTNWKLSLVLLALIPIHLLLLALLGKATMTSARGALEATEASSQHAAEVLGELPSLFAWDGQGLAISRFQSLLAAAQAKLERTAHLHAVSRSLFGFLLLSMFSLGAWFAGRIVVDGAGAGAVLTVFLCAVLAGSSTQSIRARVKEFNTGRKAAFAVYSLLEMPSSIPGEDEGGFRPAASLSGGRSVVFRNAEIAPMGNGYGINGLDLVCSAGSSTAVRCTPEEFATLYASLLRLVPSIGIQIDSVRLDEYDAPFLRRGMVGVAGAGVPAFGGTIREVICEGVPRATYDENEVWEALYRVGLADSVRTLPGALDSSVLVLGQGQRERLGIARVLYKKAEIIVLDEPAPTLSEAEERELVAAVCAGWEGRRPTVILRSLRDSVERVCEGGAGFHHGQLVDSGALAELAANPSTMFGKLRAAHHAVSARAESPQLRRMRRIGQTDKTSPASGSDSDSYLDSSNASEIDAREPPVDPLGFRKDGSGDTLVAEHGKGFDDDGEMSVVPVPRFSLGDVVNLSKPETGLLILGTLAAIVRGGVMPLFAVTLAQLLSLYAFGTDISVGAHFWCIVVVTIASLEGLVFYLKVLCFEIAGERLTMRVRKRAFDAVLGHPMDWFMVREHSKAAIMKALATDAPKVRGATTSAWGNLIGWLATVVGGLIWSVFLGWKLAVIAWAPVLASFGVSRLEAWAATRFASQERKGYETANRIAGEALFAWRTVVVNGLEERCANKYAVALEVAADAATRGRVVSSLAFGLSQGLLFLSQALFWWLAASLLRPFDYDLLSILMIWSLASFCGSAAARAGELRRVVKDSKRALMSIAMLMAPSAARENGRYLGDAAPVRGAIEVSQLGYDDPDSGESLLAGFDMVIAPGEHVVIVGCSEEEKDALIGLLTGLLTPQRGRIVVDSMDVREWESTVYRQHVASFWDRNVRVFSGTIADNIALGVVGVQPERIVEIGEAVELQDQVRRLDRGWETVIGAGGVAVDAETADRIGLARVVLRQTPLLIVDDPPRGSGARGLVEMAEYGRTVVRFTDDLPSAIKCRIVVVSGGQVIEAGTHAELLENGGAYYALWNGSAG